MWAQEDIKMRVHDRFKREEEGKMGEGEGRKAELLSKDFSELWQIHTYACTHVCMFVCFNQASLICAPQKTLWRCASVQGLTLRKSLRKLIYTTKATALVGSVRGILTKEET